MCSGLDTHTKTPGSVGSQADKDHRCLGYPGAISWALPCACPAQTRKQGTLVIFLPPVEGELLKNKTLNLNFLEKAVQLTLPPDVSVYWAL